MDIKEIKQIVDLMKKSDLTEFAVEEENFKLKIKRDTGHEGRTQIASYAPAISHMPAHHHFSAPAPVAEQPAAKAPPEDSGRFITSPMVGTFYSASSPETPAFLKVGDSVEADSIVCIIEAMKIMNEIQSEQKGTVSEILVENGQPVEYGQKLFRLA